MAEIITTGIKLKKELGLEDFQYVRISRAAISAYRILFVFYDSYRFNMPLTYWRIKKHPAVAQILSGSNLAKSDHTKTFMTPPLDIVNFNGNILGALIIPVDLAGDRFIGKGIPIQFEAYNQDRNANVEVDKDYEGKELDFSPFNSGDADSTFQEMIDATYDKNFVAGEKWPVKDSEEFDEIPSFVMIHENLESLCKLLEDQPVGQGFTIADLVANGESERNKKFYKDRFENGNAGSFLNNVSFNKDKKTLLLTFKTIPTYDKTVGIVKNNGTLSKASYYRTYVLFEGVDYHLASPDDFLKLSKGDQISFLRNMIKTATVRVHSNDFSYFFQGAWENAEKLGWSLVPFPGPNGKGIWSNRHVGEFPGLYVSKHIVELLKIIPFLAPQIAILIRKRYGYDAD